MQLRRLSGLNREKILNEHKDLNIACEEYRAILADDTKKNDIIEQELLEIKNRYSDERKSEISLSVDLNIENEDLIPKPGHWGIPIHRSPSRVYASPWEYPDTRHG